MLGLLGDIYCAIFLRKLQPTVKMAFWREITCNNECERRLTSGLAIRTATGTAPGLATDSGFGPATGPFPPRDRLRCVSSRFRIPAAHGDTC